MQRGYLTMVVLLVMVVLVALVIALGFLVGSGSLASATRLGSTQAFFLAESGLEYDQRRWAQNLDWYRSSNDPNPTAPAAQGVGTGTFTVSGYLPATMLSVTMGTGAATASVYTVGRFPTSGILQISEDLTVDAEFVRYTGVGAASFTGLTRGQTVGTVASLAQSHGRGNIVYPVTILRTAMVASCAPLASIQIDAHGKFLSAGSIDIESEEISYAGSSTTGGLTTLTGITRCLGLTTLVSHAIGQPVTPVLVGGDSASNQVEIVATGTMGSSVRYARRTVAR